MYNNNNSRGASSHSYGGGGHQPHRGGSTTKGGSPPRGNEIPVFQSVRIRVGMRILNTEMHTLQQCPTSVLAQLFSPPFPLYDEYEDIHRFPREYVSKEAFEAIIDALRSNGEWAPIRTTAERDEVVRAVGVLGPLDILPPVPRALDSTTMVMSGGTDRFHQMATQTENIKELRRRAKEKREKEEAYAKYSRELEQLEAALSREEEALASAQKMAATYRESAENAKEHAANFEAEMAKIDAELKEVQEEVDDFTAGLEPINEETESLTRDARKAKLAAATQSELADAAEAAAKAAEQKNPDGGDPIKDETLEEAAAKARAEVDGLKKDAEEKRVLADAAKEKSDSAQAQLDKASARLTELKESKEGLQARSGGMANDVESTEEVAKQMEEAVAPLQQKRDAACAARDEAAAKKMENEPEEEARKRRPKKRKIVKKEKPPADPTPEEAEAALDKWRKRGLIQRYYEVYDPEKLETLDQAMEDPGVLDAPYADLAMSFKQSCYGAEDPETRRNRIWNYFHEVDPAQISDGGARFWQLVDRWKTTSDETLWADLKAKHGRDVEEFEVPAGQEPPPLAELLGERPAEYTDHETDEEEPEVEPTMHPLSICPPESLRIIPDTVRDWGRKGYCIKGEFRGDMDVDPPAPAPAAGHAHSSSSPSPTFTGGSLGGGGAGGRLGGGGGGGGGGLGGGRRNFGGGGLGRGTLGGGTSRRTASEDRERSVRGHTDRGVSETASTAAAGAPAAYGGGGTAAVQPFRGSKNMQYCDQTTILFEKQLERLDHLQTLAFEAPTGDFFRQKRPTGLLQTLIDFASYADPTLI